MNNAQRIYNIVRRCLHSFCLEHGDDGERAEMEANIAGYLVKHFGMAIDDATDAVERGWDDILEQWNYERRQLTRFGVAGVAEAKFDFQAASREGVEAVDLHAICYGDY